MSKTIDFKKILDSIPKEELKMHFINESPLYGLVRNVERRIANEFMGFRPEPKTELLSPEGEVLMRDGEIVDKGNPKLYVGMDFGYKSYSQSFVTDESG